MVCKNVDENLPVFVDKEKSSKIMVVEIPLSLVHASWIS